MSSESDSVGTIARRVEFVIGVSLVVLGAYAALRMPFRDSAKAIIISLIGAPLLVLPGLALLKAGSASDDRRRLFARAIQIEAVVVFLVLSAWLVWWSSTFVPMVNREKLHAMMGYTAAILILLVALSTYHSTAPHVGFGWFFVLASMPDSVLALPIACALTWAYDVRRDPAPLAVPDEPLPFKPTVLDGAADSDEQERGGEQ